MKRLYIYNYNYAINNKKIISFDGSTICQHNKKYLEKLLKG